jgi:hypothetical protein
MEPDQSEPFFFFFLFKTCWHVVRRMRRDGRDEELEL